MQQDEEKAIVERVLAGHSGDFAVVVKEYHARIYALMKRQVGDPATAEDLTQETFLRAYTGLKSFRGDASLGTWLIRIALNQANNFFASKRYRQSRLSESFTHDKHDTKDPGMQPGDELTYQVHVEQLRLALGKLKPALREVLVLCGLEGRSYEEVAAVLQIPVGTVRSRLNKARLLVKDLLLAAAAKEVA